ncbi:MAG: hypothetical protein ACNS60_00915 [Candidatus Cyclobacteriaceae bacterium M2_1C_046]
MKKWYHYLLEVVVIIGSIMLAFWLEEWGDERKEKAKLSATLKSIKNELQDNAAIMKRDYVNLSDFNNYCKILDQYEDTSDSGITRVIFPKAAFDSVKAAHYKNIRFTRDMTFNKASPDGKVEYYAEIDIDFLLGDITSTSFTSAKETGILNQLDHETLLYINHSYNWFMRDLGNISTSDVHNVMLFGTDGSPYADFNNITKAFNKFEIIYGTKLAFLDSLLPYTFQRMDQYIIK